jgi:phosphatidylglycerophosphatase C
VTSEPTAVFDLDGTITKRDTLLPFLRNLNTGGTTMGLMRASPWIGMSAFDRTHRDRAKEILLRSTLGGQTVDRVHAAAERFSRGLIPRGLVPEVVDRIERHRAKGHRIAVASASPDVVVAAIARRLEIDTVIATKLEIVDGCYTGRYGSHNVRSGEKLRRVIESLGCAPSHAYGNLPDDEPLLSAAASGFVVKGRRIEPYR